MYDSGKMLDSELCLMGVLGGDIDAPFPVDLIKFLEHGGICALKINKSRELKPTLL